MLTICYTTARENPRFEWFLDGLLNQVEGEPDFELLVIDFHNDARPLVYSIPERFMGWAETRLRFTTPKPSVWQGKHRRTRDDFFAQANTRNTGICMARGDYIVFVDDLSVPLPGWLKAARESAAVGRIVCGGYRKVRQLVVEKGSIVSYVDSPAGRDHRYQYGTLNGAVKCLGQWFYGCSCGAPLEAFLRINGYPEITDGMGYEDSVTGSMLERHGYLIVYDARMMTYEAEELHSEGKRMLRWDPGNSPADKSHALLSITSGAKETPGYFGPGGIRGLRDRIQAGGEFPVERIPEHEWFTGKRLEDLDIDRIKAGMPT